MSSFVSRESDPSGRQFYCRKEKSLGVLCTNFLRLYEKGDVELIGLDDAATRLGVERRRIYDVVNILESVGVVARKQKNRYSWKGFEAIPRALEYLKQEGFRENFGAFASCNSAKVASENENEKEGSSISKTDGQDDSSATSKSESKREKSLWLLTQNFVKLFLCSDVDLITLDNAAVSLLGDGHNSTAMRTKVRRLYDIANVFSSMNLIEKTHHPDSRKPAFRWLGWTGNNGSMTLDQPKKRNFGTEITNCNVKRNKMDSSIEWNQNKENVSMVIRCKDMENDCNENKVDQHTKHSSKCVEFGPFTPVSVQTVGDSKNKTESRIQDLERLTSTYYPQYNNRVLSDLFGHYVEAWKSWYVEVDVKEKTHKGS